MDVPEKNPNVSKRRGEMVWKKMCNTTKNK